MSLVLYRRHLRGCAVHDLNLPSRAKKFYKDCECPVWIFGRTDRVFMPRQSTGYTDWAAAEAVRASYMAGSKDEAVHGPRLADCAKQYLESRAHELSDKTYGQHELLLGRLRSYCEARNAYFVSDLTVDILERFKVEGLPSLADTSKGTSISKLRCFLKEAFRRGWTSEPLDRKVRPHHAVYDQKEPYTDEEIEKILNGALKLTGGTHAYAKHPATFRLLLEVMLETGMRVSDAIRFDPANLEKGERMYIYSYAPQKQKRTDKQKFIEAYLTDDLRCRIMECDWLSSELPFLYGSFRNQTYLGNEVYERMKTIGKRCGVADCRPHRLRDTFAVRKLSSGLTLDDVSRLLGHSSVKVTELYYAKWDPRRKSRLERLVAESLPDLPGDLLRD